MKTTTHIEIENVSSTYINYNLAIEITADKGETRLTVQVTEEQARSIQRQLDEKIKRLDDDRIEEAKRQLAEATDSE